VSIEHLEERVLSKQKKKGKKEGKKHRIPLCVGLYLCVPSIDELDV